MTGSGSGTVAPGEPFGTTTSTAEFRAQVEEWFEGHAPKKGGEGDFSTAHIVSGTSVEEFRHNEGAGLRGDLSLAAELFEASLVGRSWPSEYGGHSAPAWQDEVIAEVQSRYGVSTKMAAVALEMLPAVLFDHGTHEQRLTHLPAVVRGDEGWCQLLSEPDAGSDLGSVRTSSCGRRGWLDRAGPEGLDVGGRLRLLRTPRGPDRTRRRRHGRDFPA